MSKDYQQKRRNGKYILPATVYHQAIWLIRDYYRMKGEMEEIITASPSHPEGMPSGGGLSNEVESKVMQRMKYFKKVDIIERMFQEIPVEYQKGVWNNIQYGKAYPKDACRATYSRYKSMYIYLVAVEMEFIKKTIKK